MVFILTNPPSGVGRLAINAVAIARKFNFTKDAARGGNNTLLGVRSNASRQSSHLIQVDLVYKWPTAAVHGVHPLATIATHQPAKGPISDPKSSVVSGWHRSAELQFNATPFGGLDS